ncbi:hypothetical protein VH79_25790 [Salmonella enterica]|uniref:Uncharacterized protein n=1 Tax=Salmonella enterica TaxID=28901 RepID=A0A5U3IKT6_SALER|nr:hypothetical protein [Salmonella enterica]
MADDKETERKLLVAEYYELKERAEDAAKTRQALLDSLPFEVSLLNGDASVNADRVKAMLIHLEDADHSMREMVARARSVAALCGRPEITLKDLLSRFGKSAP